MNKKKIILSLLLATITLNVATVSMSIAWYSSGNVLNVDMIDIALECDKEFKISKTIDGEYKQQLEYNDDDIETLFMPVTSAYSSEWMDIKSSKPHFYDDSNTITSNIVETPHKETTQGYFSTSIYLLSDDDIYVTIGQEKTFLVSNREKNKEYAQEVYEEIQSHEDDPLKHLTAEDIYERLNKLETAMRFSILDPHETDYSYAIIDPYKDDDVYFGGLLDNDLDEYFDYYNQESEHISYERVYGDISNREKIVYDDASNVDSDLVDTTVESNAFNAKHRHDVKLFNIEKSLANGVVIQKEQAYGLNEFNDNSSKNPYHIKLYKDQPKEIVLSIYIEGWDLESVNYTMGASFLASLSLKIEREY